MEDIAVIKEIVSTLLIAVVGSNAIFSFIQFIITRHDNKKGMEKELGKTNEKIDNVEAKFDKRIDETQAKIAENQAILARTHILRFADEQRSGTVHHSKEYFEQQLDDIKTYNDYCDEHKDFKNERAVMASEYIKEEYKRIYLSND